MKFPNATTLWLANAALAIGAVAAWHVPITGGISNGGLSFYGFSIGESKTDSISNMRNRKMSYLDYVSYLQLISQSPVAAVPMKGECRETANTNGISMIACFPEQSDVNSVALIYLNDTLVKVVAEFNPNSAEVANEHIHEKYGSSELAWSHEQIASWEDKFKDSSAAAFSPLISPFGMNDGLTCGQCQMSEIAQNDNNNRVYIRHDDGHPSYLTLVNAELVQRKMASVFKTLDRKVAEEKKSGEF